ncbi:DUF1624 domain-containing protein [Candidatus Peribacteria bacterium]|nr:DUF1624 domain-containing protein [Candidatus Peribacteria bacterium]
MQKDNKRFIELDYLRVIAIALMIAYHLVYDLQIYYGFETNLYGTFWSVLEKISAGMFLMLTGLCFTLSWESTPQYGKFLKRGLRILAYAAVISIVTYAFDPVTFVRFGILHLIAVTTVLLPLFTRLGRLNSLIGLLVLATGIAVKGTIVDTPLLLPFGFLPAGFNSVDYFPLLPWFGVSLIGMALGYGYETSRNKWFVPATSQSRLQTIVTSISKRSLFIYMLHQPVLLLMLRLALGTRS